MYYKELDMTLHLGWWCHIASPTRLSFLRLIRSKRRVQRKQTQPNPDQLEVFEIRKDLKDWVELWSGNPIKALLYNEQDLVLRNFVACRAGDLYLTIWKCVLSIYNLVQSPDPSHRKFSILKSQLPRTMVQIANKPKLKQPWEPSFDLPEMQQPITSVSTHCAIARLPRSFHYYRTVPKNCRHTRSSLVQLSHHKSNLRVIRALEISWIGSSPHVHRENQNTRLLRLQRRLRNQPWRCVKNAMARWNRAPCFPS